jgi:SNF2 family DNA or RNA helicase
VQSLSTKQIPKALLDAELASEGITRLLKKGWVGNAKIVLTTYETLRGLEFSLAAQRWSIMICDEAQKIKNPNAMVTRAAKKQNVRFRIACTGTPVENTLTDIWCLFDFIQAGLLGALSEFGRRYRKPIEAESDEEKERVEELRGIIKPQLLRREKKDVAKDLPAKTTDQACRRLPMSQHQRTLYARGIAKYRKEAATNPAAQLGVIHFLRRICSDPLVEEPYQADRSSVEEILQASPKMAWLMQALHQIRQRQEKVIVFCEFRDLQRTLQRCIADRLDVHPDIINGDTSASSSHADSRQKRLKAFQSKPGFGVIVLSPLAVGFGVNIQAANHVIHFTRTWNPAKEDQATDRAYRIGQEREVFVYYPVVVADDFVSFDEKLDKLLDWKRALSADMLNGSGEISVAELLDIAE